MFIICDEYLSSPNDEYLSGVSANSNIRNLSIDVANVYGDD